MALMQKEWNSCCLIASILIKIKGVCFLSELGYFILAV